MGRKHYNKFIGGPTDVGGLNLPRQNLLAYTKPLTDRIGISERPVQPLRSGYFNGTGSYYCNTGILVSSFVNADFEISLSFTVPNLTAKEGSAAHTLFGAYGGSIGLCMRILDTGVFVLQRGDGILNTPSGLVVINTDYRLRITFIKATGVTTFYLNNNQIHQAVMPGFSTDVTESGLVPLRLGEYGAYASYSLTGNLWDVDINNIWKSPHPVINGTQAIWFDTSGNGNNAVATVADANVHCASGLTFGSDVLNQQGGITSLAGWYANSSGTISIPAGTFLPAGTKYWVESVAYIVAATGRVKYSLVPKAGPCATGASGTSISMPGVTGATVLSKEGTAIPTIGTNAITFTSGTLYNLKLTLVGGTILTIPFSESAGTTVYGYNETTGAVSTGTVTAADINAFWGSTQDSYFHGLMYGYSLSGSARIPANPLTPGLDCLGNPLQYTSGKLNASCKYALPAAYEVTKELGLNSAWFDSSGAPLVKTYAQMLGLGTGSKFYFGTKGSAVYSTYQTTTSQRIKRVLGVS